MSHLRLNSAHEPRFLYDVPVFGCSPTQKHATIRCKLRDLVVSHQKTFLNPMLSHDCVCGVHRRKRAIRAQLNQSREQVAKICKELCIRSGLGSDVLEEWIEQLDEVTVSTLFEPCCQLDLDVCTRDLRGMDPVIRCNWNHKALHHEARRARALGLKRGRWA